MGAHSHFLSERSKEVHGRCVLEVRSIPLFSVLGNELVDVLAQVKDSFTKTLNEYGQMVMSKPSYFEMAWISKQAKNQSYKADMAIYLTLGITCQTIEEVDYRLEELKLSIISNLAKHRFSVHESSFDLPQYINQTKDHLTRAYAIRKAERIDYHQNGLLNEVYAYGLFSDACSEMDDLFNFMMQRENHVYVLHVIPTLFSPHEKSFIHTMTSNLSQLVTGVSSPQGYIRDATLQPSLDLYTHYRQQMDSVVFLYNAFVMGEEHTAYTMASKVKSQFEKQLNKDNTPFQISMFNESIQITSQNPYAYPFIINHQVMLKDRLPIFYQYQSLPTFRLAHLVSATELSDAFRIPVGGKNITSGIKMIDVEQKTKSYRQGIINDADMILGTLSHTSSIYQTELGFNLKDLTKHMLVVGTPGSGKSTFLVGLMDRLWRKHKIPFLVIEPAKNEYRSLIATVPDLQVFSPGNNAVAPYIINPFIPPKGVRIESYKSIVKSAFGASFDMWTPLDQLFDETLNLCYGDIGWLDYMTIDETQSGQCFTLMDFIETYRQVVNSKDYTGEFKKQIETAGVLRLNGLLEQNLNIFDNRHTVSIEDILEKPTVIELSNVKDIKQKSFIIAFLLNNIYAYAESNLKNDGLLKFVILLEEAHVLLSGDQVSMQGEQDQANQYAVRLLTHMLAEIRSRGVGIVVADQSSRKVSSEVIANTNIKLMFRLVEAMDRNIVKNATTMTQQQLDRLPKLKTGEAMVYFDALDDVEEITLSDYRLENQIGLHLDDETLKSTMHYWDERFKQLMPHQECDYIKRCEKGCQFDCRAKARIVADRLVRQLYPLKFQDFNSFKNLYQSINPVMKSMVDQFFGQGVYEDIYHCVKVHFLRRVHYQTKVSIPLDVRIKAIESMKV